MDGEPQDDHGDPTLPASSVADMGPDPQDDDGSPALDVSIFPPEILSMIFEMFHGEYDHLEGECMHWAVTWVPKYHAEWDPQVVPYVFLSSRSRVRRTNTPPNPMLHVCRASRAIALDPELGRYASLPVQHSEVDPMENDPYGRWDGDGYVIVRPCRDVFSFSYHSGYSPETVLIWPEDGVRLGLRHLVFVNRRLTPPYGINIEWLEDAVTRTGFRHVLIPKTFAVEVDDDHTWIYFWVLVHLCKHVNPGTGRVMLRAHHLHLFLPCGIPEDSRPRVVTAAFARMAHMMGHFPVGFPQGDLMAREAEQAGENGEDETTVPPVPPDCECMGWPMYEHIFELGQPDLLQVVEYLLELEENNASNEDDADGADGADGAA